MKSVGEWTAWISNKCAFIALIAMMALILLEVVLRATLHISTLVAHEFSSYILIFFVFIALAQVTKKDRHIKIIMITSRLPARFAKTLEILMYLLTLILVVYMFYWSLDMTITAVKNYECAETVAGTPLAIPKSFIPLGLFLFALQLVVSISDKIRSFSSAPRLESGEEMMGKSGQQL